MNSLILKRRFTSPKRAIAAPQNARPQIPWTTHAVRSTTSHEHSLTRFPHHRTRIQRRWHAVLDLYVLLDFESAAGRWHRLPMDRGSAADRGLYLPDASVDCPRRVFEDGMVRRNFRDLESRGLRRALGPVGGRICALKSRRATADGCLRSIFYRSKKNATRPANSQRTLCPGSARFRS